MRKRYIVRIPNKAIQERVELTAFSQGYMWSGGSKQPYNTHVPWLFFYPDIKRILMSTTEEYGYEQAKTEGYDLVTCEEFMREITGGKYQLDEGLFEI